VVLIAVLGEIRNMLPFPLLGFDTDNDSVFLNETVRDYCLAAGIAFKDWRRGKVPRDGVGATAGSRLTLVDEATGALDAATGAPDEAIH
jgi:hypothetical protein